jgi:transposase
MTKMKNVTIGVDVSKDYLDVHRLNDGHATRFANNTTGLAALLKWCNASPLTRVVYEATGAYHAALERACSARLPLVKVNPLQARRFAQAQGTRAKTDAVDARILAQMGKAFNLQPDKPITENLRSLKELQVTRTALIRDQTRTLNRQKNQTLKLTRGQSKARLDQIKRQIVKVETEIKRLIQMTRESSRAMDILLSIPGIGAVCATTVLIEMPEIGTLTRKQAASLTGVAPMVRQSGRWRGKAFIQGGRKTVRDALYMPALVAARYNPDLKTKYQTMIKAGKPPKVALTALMRKLIELANALIKADRKWQPKDA